MFPQKEKDGILTSRKGVYVCVCVGGGIDNYCSRHALVSKSVPLWFMYSGTRTGQLNVWIEYCSKMQVCYVYLDFSVPVRILISVLIIFRIHRETWTFTVRVYVINSSILISDDCVFFAQAPVLLYFLQVAAVFKAEKNGTTVACCRL